MINGLVGPLKSIKDTNYNNNLILKSLNNSRNMLLTLAEIVHRSNQLQNCIRKLEMDTLIIYNFIDSISQEIVIPT